MSMQIRTPTCRHLLLAAVLIGAISTVAQGQVESRACTRAFRALQLGSPRTADLDLIAESCPRGDAQVRAQALQLAHSAVAALPSRLGALRILVAGILPEAWMSSQWLATARLGDMPPRQMHAPSAIPATAAQREEVRSALEVLARSDADAEMRRASLVLLQALIRTFPALATIEPNTVRLFAKCGDIVRFETTADISLPYVVRVEGTAYERTVWMKPVLNGEPSWTQWALPPGIVTISVADVEAARLETRPGPCP